MRNRILFPLILLGLWLSLASCQEVASIRTLTRGARSRSYAVLVPTCCRPDHPSPVIIFLHGIGEGGNDIHAALRVGLGPYVEAHMDTFPFICIFPQSEDGKWEENSPATQDVIAELDEVAKTYKIDPDRVVLTGLSTGGYGSYAIGARYKNRFSALIPVATSESDEKDVALLRDMPIRAFHNSGDPFAAIANDSGMIQKLRAAGNTGATLVTYDAFGHDCWTTAYADPALWEWAGKQTRSSRVGTHP